MAKEVIKAASLYIHGSKLAGNANKLEFGLEAETVETTNFASCVDKEYLQGLRSAALNAEVMLDAAAEPELTLDGLYTAGTEAAFSATKTYPPAAGDVCWFAKVFEQTMTLKQVLGDLWRASLAFANRSIPCRGKVLESNTGRSSTGNSASLTMAAVGATEKLVGTVHVVSVTGTSPTLDLVIESDSSDTYGSPVTRVTVPQFTAAGSYTFTVDGAITDTEYRVAATVGGTTPVFEYLVAIGIAAL